MNVTERNGNATECPHCGGMLGRGDALCPQCGKPRPEAPKDRRAKVVPFRPRKKDPRRDLGRGGRGSAHFPSGRQVRLIWLIIFAVALLIPYLWNH